ncbi:hypothetical protein [Iodobacter sp.]|uniref:hypothetical protein n=1 Tax=Iodobacter sp. TaxID=1915058 RepID=UPI0025DD11C7|nr:hypothetical protein [Iodobacter sp.]
MILLKVNGAEVYGNVCGDFFAAYITDNSIYSTKASLKLGLQAEYLGLRMV